MSNKTLLFVQTDEVEHKGKLVTKAWVNIFRPGRDKPIEMCGYGNSKRTAVRNLQSLAKGTTLNLIYHG